MSVVLVTNSREGHRATYVALFSEIFAAEISRPNWSLVRQRQPILFLMIEEAFGRYVTVSLLRSVLGLRTVGLLFRPLPALHGRSLRLRLKSLALRLLREMPRVTTFTILPFAVETRFATIADDWIYDPQLWDLSKDPAHDRALAEEIGRRSEGRVVMSAIGIQDGRKGFDWLSDLYAESSRLQERMLFVAGGHIDPSLRESLAKLAQTDALIINRFISDEEVLSLYAASDLVWCSYAEDYDQASGIFGRAIQLGVTPVVRSGSLIHKQCLADGLKHIAVTEEDAAEKLLAFQPQEKQREPRAADWRQGSIAKLSKALGVSS